MLITSRDNPRVKHLAALVSQSRARREQAQTIIDGVHLIECALAAGVPLLEVCVSERGTTNEEIVRLLTHMAGHTTILTVTDAVFRHLSPVDSPVGILARIEVPQPLAPQPSQSALVILDGIQDPGNLGSILRTVLAAGINSVWLTPGCAQAWAPKTLRAAMGAHFRLQIREGVDRAISLDGFKVIATGLGEKSVSLFEADLRDPVAWLFGAEGQGVSFELLSRADVIVRIPMAPGVESLNVGAAAAVCLFEQKRQISFY